MVTSNIYIISLALTMLLVRELNIKRKADYIKLDRIDIHCEIQAVPFAQLSQMQPGEPSSNIRERVIAARRIQEERFKPFKGIHCNAQMTERMLHEFAEPDAASLDMLRMAMERLKLSARAYSRILKVARTIATSPARRKKSPCISPRPSGTGTWIEAIGQREGYKKRQQKNG